MTTENDGDIMNRKAFFAFVLGAASAAWAGSISGKVSGVNGRSVVYVDIIAGKSFPAPKERPSIDQKGLAFSPHLIPVQQGTTVEFLNSDTVQHDAFWPSVGGDKKASHNMGTWPKGAKRAFTFQEPGVVRLMCNVHPEMSAFIVVSPTPYFAETDEAGNYTIKEVPDGSYNVVVWHEGAKEQTREIKVLGSTNADFMMRK
jgi:plastocyanin